MSRFCGVSYMFVFVLVCICVFFVVFFFFFQAEDGIRDLTVTGVQTCALPIFAVVSCGRRNLFGHPHASVLDAFRERGIRTRSEERRVGKSVDLGGRRIIKKKKKNTKKHTTQ